MNLRDNNTIVFLIIGLALIMPGRFIIDGKTLGHYQRYDYRYRLAENTDFLKAEGKLPRQPATGDEVKDMAKKAARTLPEGLERAWEEAVAIWTKMYEQAESFWRENVKAGAQSLWERIQQLFKKEAERRKPIIEEEFKKEKEEMKEEAKTELPEIIKGLRGRFLELIK